MVERGELERECAVFGRYLCGAEPDEYVRGKYVAAHELGVVELPGTTRVERAVVALARKGPWLARAMDSQARILGNGSLVRRKLVLLLALLESRSPSAEALDAPTPGSALGMFARLAWLAAAFAFAALLGALLLVPLRIVCALGGRR